MFKTKLGSCYNIFPINLFFAITNVHTTTLDNFTVCKRVSFYEIPCTEFSRQMIIIQRMQGPGLLSSAMSRGSATTLRGSGTTFRGSATSRGSTTTFRGSAITKPPPKLLLPLVWLMQLMTCDPHTQPFIDSR